MNNQELINYTQEERRTHQKSNSFQLGYRTAMKRVYDRAVRLDELRKPVVPQFVADWYEDNKYTFEYSIVKLIEDSSNNAIEDNDLRLWFGYDLDNDKPIETLVNMHQFGYKVYKEKLYRARHKLTGEYLSQNYTKTGYYHGLDHFHILKLSKKDWEELGVLGDKVYEIEEVEE
ncbi:hypothetical protein [Streptococcus phage P738]|nr:hypothetical protein [Streptococcus phage P738]